MYVSYVYVHLSECFDAFLSCNGRQAGTDPGGVDGVASHPP